MFDDRSNKAGDAVNPASMLLMQAIVSGGISEEVETEPLGGSNGTERPVETFLADHEQTLRRTPDEGLPPVSRYEDDVSPETDFVPTAGLTWWQRMLAGTSVGLEITNGSIRVAKVRRWGRRQEVMAVLEESLEHGVADDRLVVSERLKQILRRLKAGSAPVSSILPGHDMNIRLLRIPKVSKKEIHDALLWKNKKELHFFNDAPTVLHYVILDEEKAQADNEFHVMVVAVKEESIKRHLAILGQAGILPAKLIIRPVAQWNLVRLLSETGGHLGVIDVGLESTHVTFYSNGSLQFAREIPIGGHHFTKALMQTIFVDRASHILDEGEAEALKREVGLAPESSEGKTPGEIPFSEIGVMMRPVAEKLLSEIRLSMDYFAEQFKADHFDHLWLTGNGGRLKGLRSFLESEIGHKLAVWSPGSLRSEPGGAIGTQLADTIGAALSGASDFSFLPQNMQTEWKYRRALSKALYGFLILILTIGTTAFMLHRRKLDVQAIRERMSASLIGMNERLQVYDDLSRQYGRWEAAENVLRKETQPDSTMAAVMRILSVLTPKEIVIDQVSWGQSFNETERRRQESKARMKDNGLVTATDSNAFRVRGAVYLDVFFADVHLLNFINALDRASFLEDIRLLEKRHDPEADVTYFELVAKKKETP